MTGALVADRNAADAVAPGAVTRMAISRPETALAAISQAYAPSKLEVLGSDSDFDLRLNVLHTPGMTYGHSRFGTDVRVTALPPSCYVVCFAPVGGLRVATTRSFEDISHNAGAVLYPYEATFFENWDSDTELVSLRIEAEVLERSLARMTGHPVREPIRFEPGCDLDGTDTTAFRRTLRLLEQELASGSALTSTATGAAQLAELVTMSLLVSQPNNYSDLIHEPVTALPRGPIRAARELIDADPMSIGTVGELADKVHTSVRSLEHGFRTHLDTSPMAYLRRARLDRAHQDLRTADSTRFTVRAIAHRWGFTHLGRFARYHHEVFGELPAATLR